MQTRIIEVVQGPGGPNHGKFVVGLFTWEWTRRVELPDVEDEIGLLSSQGWNHSHVFLLDLATGEGALFRLGGHARNDLERHAIWVCPLFEPFLEWLYNRGQPLDLAALPDVVQLEAPFAFKGYRRRGPLRCDDCDLALDPEEISIFFTRDCRRLCPGCAGQEPVANIVREAS